MAMPASTTTYAQVRHKQTEGTLLLTSLQLTLQPSSTSTSAAAVHSNTNGNSNTTATLAPVRLPWDSVAKHQVSPATHTKHLLKLNLIDGKSMTFRLQTRQDLERVRRDITQRLKKRRAALQQHHHNNNNKKSLNGSSLHNNTTTASSLSFGVMDPTALAVTRSSLLAAHPTLRAQHHYLVTETQTLTEDDFWQTHQSLVEEEYAKICGTTKAGSSSLLMSHLVTQTQGRDNKVTLGVEEMRQIFILYPAVHKAYEEKVPLELSDEQFWRKYLESEFFHRDRGRLGTAARNHSSAKKQGTSTSISNGQSGGKKDSQGNKLTLEEQDARAAAVGADDFFSRYDQKLRDASSTAASSAATTTAAEASKKKWGTNLAVGQFDLASTFETERGHLLEGPCDMHPNNEADDGKGARVVKKYNRHWAMVLHPDEAVAGSDLMNVARRSVKQVLKDDSDAKAKGGLNVEMKRLVNFANSTEEDANHVTGTGLEDEDFRALKLRNLEAYNLQKRQIHQKESEEDAAKRRRVFAHQEATRMQTLAKDVRGTNMISQVDCVPKGRFGRDLMIHLTKRMAKDAKTDADRNEIVERLDEEFKKNLNTYFRRSSELLRHFYGLRKLEAEGGGKNEKKLSRIVKGLEAVYREMEAIRKALPQSEDGEIMRKMCLPIMDQLDWAFKLQRDTANGGGGGGGGFVTIEDF